MAEAYAHPRGIIGLRCDDERLDEIISQLNTGDVKVDDLTGLVRMKMAGVWYILCAGDVDFDSFRGELVIDYDRLRIGVVVNGKVNYMIRLRSRAEMSYTLYKHDISKLDTDNDYLGVIDGQTGKYIALPPITYVAANGIFNGNGERIATAGRYRQLPQLKSFQNLHIICNHLVFMSDEPVSVVDGYVRVGDRIYGFYGRPSIHESPLLMSEYDQIELHYLYKYHVPPDQPRLGPDTTFKGCYTIPHCYMYRKVLEFGNVWLGVIGMQEFVLLVPSSSKTGRVTKPAVAVTEFE